MKKILLILLIFKILIFANNYNDFLLKIQAKIYPKIILLDKKIDKKLVDGKIIVGIVYDKGDFFIANRVKNLIKSLYGSRLDEYEFKVVPIDMLNILNDRYSNFSYLYILKSIPDRFERLSLFVNRNKIVTFIYDKNDLKYGFLFSLDIKREPIIYMNKKISKIFDFNQYLYSIVRFVDEG